MESTGKEMEAAQKSGDVEEQRKAASKMMATVIGSNGTIETLAPDRIKTFLPEKLDGRARSNVSAERSGAMGFQISTAQASYKDDSGNNLELRSPTWGLPKA